MGLNEAQKKERSDYLERNLNITECSQKKPYAFISYASDNWETVFKTAVVPMQQKYGLCVYADKAFDKVNDKWIVPMLRNVRGADLMIAFVSQSYIESYACFLELLTAVNNKKQIVFVSLEQDLHLGDTTDLPNVERGVKNEILNQGANIATNTNNSSNDLMRAMKSAYTSISTLLEQDALSKYDISDAFINFFRDASINRKTINDLGAVRGTIKSVSSNVFDPTNVSKAAKPPQSAPVPQTVPEVKPAEPEKSVSEPEVQTQTVSAPPPAPDPNPVYEPTVQPATESFGTENTSAKPKFDFRNKKFIVILVSCVCCLAIIIGTVIAVSPKNVKDMPYLSDMIAVDGVYTELEGTYTGKWKNNMPYGYGTLTLSNGCIYSGEWKNGEANGQGKYTDAYGNVYEGEFKDDKQNGHGTYTFANGDVYEGEWKDDHLNGQGKATSANGAVYEGEFKNNYFNGQGKLTYANGDVYEGEFKDGNRSGQGKLTYANGDAYEGEFKDGNRSGQGKLTFANGDVYEGEWKDNKHNGQGLFTSASGVVYVGEFKDGCFHGQGKMTWTDGSFYEGEFKNDRRDGQGIYTTANGSVQSGLWKDGNFVGDKISEDGFGAPGNIVVTDAGDAAVGITWDIVPDATKYQLYGYFNPEFKEPQFSSELEYAHGAYGNVVDDYTYYVALRAVCEKDGKETYSDWTYISFKRLSEGEYEYYSGGFKDGKKDGQGKMTYVGGAVYEGEWKDDVYNGQGKFYYTTGTVYEGEWKDGKWNGQGKVIWADGNVYEGEFKDNKYNGQGKLTYINGDVKTGLWEDGNFVG